MSTYSTPKLPPLDGSLFFSDLINFHMQNNPALPMWVYPNNRCLTEITFLEFGRAAHKIAHALRPERTGDDRQVVMLIANTDTILYHAIVAGMSIASLVPFPVSPRNSPAAVINMMKKVNCSRIMTLYHAHQSLIDGVRDQDPGLAFAVEEMPDISYAFPKLGGEVEVDPFIPYPQSTSRPDPNIPSFYIHSSGSTGFPKPVPQSFKVQIHLMSSLMTAYFHKLSPGSRIGTMALPPFHAFGVSMQLCMPLASLVTAVVYPPQALSDRQAVPIVPTSDNVLDSVRRTHCKVLMTVPTFLEQWAPSVDAVEVLTDVDQVIYSGGPLTSEVGNALWAAGVNITTVYGGTEFGCPVYIRQREEIEDGEWMWLRVRDEVRVRWVPQGDDTYECQVLTTENNQMSIENLPDAKGYATSDLFIKHPTKNLWKIVGRADDVITLASGEKIVPTPMEDIIMTSPLLQGVVMFGRERNQVGVLVEPRPEHAVNVLDENAVATFRSEIWSVIEKANKIAPAFARIFKEMILIVDSELPMTRTAKGTVQRKATIKAYETRISSLYSNVEDTDQSSSGPIEPLAWTVEGVLAWLTELASAINQGRTLDPSSDLFAQGFDSLSATYLRNRIVNALHKTSDPKVRSSITLVSPNVIFENPTLQLLATRIVDLTSEREVLQSSDSKLRHVIAMDAMIEKYSIGLSGSAPLPMVNGATNSLVSHPAGAVVLLTGSTGGLGSFLLSQLLENPMVERVYALNRPSSSTSIEERQSSAFIDKALSVDLLSSGKLVYVEADASQENCGFSPKLNEAIRKSVTIIIHNAWRLDFNLSLASFEPNVKATRNLVDLALEAKYSNSLRFIFTSTIGTAQSWDRRKGLFPEELQLDPSIAVGSGYAESKYVCERIIAKSGLQTTSLRIGQIAGGPNGSWATTDWVPIFVKSSIALGALPDSVGVVSWMRTEDVAAAVLDVAFAELAPQSLNIVNPRYARWSDVISFMRDAILEHMSLSKDGLAIVPLVEWVIRLEKEVAGSSARDLIHTPALKLLEFFRTMARNEDILARAQTAGSIFETGGVADFSTTEARRVSDTVSKMQPVGEMEAQAWIRYWISKGLF